MVNWIMNATDPRLKWPDNCYDDKIHRIESDYWYLLCQPHIKFHHLLKIEPVATWRPAESLTIALAILKIYCYNFFQFKLLAFMKTLLQL